MFAGKRTLFRWWPCTSTFNNKDAKARMKLKENNTPIQAIQVIFLLLWAASVGYLFATDGDWTMGIISLLIFGVALSGLAWFLTRGASVPETPVVHPARELGAVSLYLLIYTFLFLLWGMSYLKTHIEPGRLQEIVILISKLTVHVGLPVLLLVLLGAKIKPLFDPGLRERRFGRTLIVMGLVLIGLLAVVSPSLGDIAETGAGIQTLVWIVPFTYIWLMLEAGLCEEFLFRAVLQTRVTAVFRSSWAGIVITSLVFALVHVPGLYLRGDADTSGASADLWQVVAYTIAVLSPISVLFGILWARTRSLLLVVMLHASVDLLPALAESIRVWG